MSEDKNVLKTTRNVKRSRRRASLRPVSSRSTPGGGAGTHVGDSWNEGASLSANPESSTVGPRYGVHAGTRYNARLYRLHSQRLLLAWAWAYKCSLPSGRIRSAHALREWQLQIHQSSSSSSSSGRRAMIGLLERRW